MTIGFKYNFQAATGTAQAGAATTITLAAGASAADDAYNGMVINITSGLGNGQRRLISDYVGSTKVATVESAWSVNPNNTSVYDIRENPTWNSNTYPSLDAPRLDSDWTKVKAACDLLDTMINHTGGDVDKVDGCDAGTGANNVLKLNASGKVPLANLLTGTGAGLDVDTVDGAHAGTSANNVLKLDGSAKVPLANSQSMVRCASSTYNQEVGSFGNWDKIVTLTAACSVVEWFVDSGRHGFISTGGVNVCVSPGGETMIVRNVRLSGTTLTINFLNNTGYNTTHNGSVQWIGHI